MNPEFARFLGRHLRRSGAAVSLASVALLVALRFATPGGNAAQSLGQGVLLASAAMILTLFAALGLALVVAGVAFGMDRRAERPIGPVAGEK